MDSQNPEKSNCKKKKKKKIPKRIKASHACGDIHTGAGHTHTRPGHLCLSGARSEDESVHTPF